MSHPRRHQIRCLLRAVVYGSATSGMAVGALATAAQGAFVLGAALAVLAGLCAVRAGVLLRRSDRNRVGADSEAEVRRTLSVLCRDGWKARHGVNWPGRGDIDHLVTAPAAVFAVETKTLRYTAEHLARVEQAARWAGRRRRRRSVPVLVICRSRGICRREGAVLVVSPDRLVGALRAVDAGR